jgi:hypothetical protein
MGFRTPGRIDGELEPRPRGRPTFVAANRSIEVKEVMHFVRDVKFVSDYKLQLKFEDGTLREVDLAPHLDGEVFESLRDPDRFRTVRLHSKVDTIVWDNGADMSADFLYEIGVPIAESVPAA